MKFTGRRKKLHVANCEAWEENEPMVPLGQNECKMSEQAQYL